jgi:hypothetical protein
VAGVGAREENPAGHAQEGKRGDSPRSLGESRKPDEGWRCGVRAGLSASAFARANGLADEQRLAWIDERTLVKFVCTRVGAYGRTQLGKWLSTAHQPR